MSEDEIKNQNHDLSKKLFLKFWLRNVLSRDRNVRLPTPWWL